MLSHTLSAKNKRPQLKQLTGAIALLVIIYRLIVMLQKRVLGWMDVKGRYTEEREEQDEKAVGVVAIHTSVTEQREIKFNDPLMNILALVVHCAACVETRLSCHCCYTTNSMHNIIAALLEAITQQLHTCSCFTDTYCCSKN